MNSVASGSRSSTAAATASGSVESRTRRPSQSSPEPNVRCRTSGARLLPPMPATIALVKPASRMPSPKPSRAGMSLVKCSGASSQPRRSAIAACTCGSVDQSVVSRSISRSAQRSSRARATADSNAAWASSLPKDRFGTASAAAAGSLIETPRSDVLQIGFPCQGSGSVCNRSGSACN